MPPINEDAPFSHYSPRHRVTSWISQYLFGNFVYTNRHGLIKGLRRKGGLGWLPEFLSGSVETAEHRFWRSLDLRGKWCTTWARFRACWRSFSRAPPAP